LVEAPAETPSTATSQIPKQDLFELTPEMAEMQKSLERNESEVQELKAQLAAAAEASRRETEELSKTVASLAVSEKQRHEAQQAMSAQEVLLRCLGIPRIL
jgi:septal ring factor EnvC (AmiA/AmiB activator)